MRKCDDGDGADAGIDVDDDLVVGLVWWGNAGRAWAECEGNALGWRDK